MNSLDYAKKSKLKSFIPKIVQIYPPIDTKRFRKTNATKFRKRFEIKKNDVVVGFVGRLVAEKGVEYLIGAIPMMRLVKNLKVLIVGEGETVAGGKKESEKEKLVNMVKRLELNNIIFTGHINDKELIQFYSACDILVLPSISKFESFGMVQVESLLCGTPVVATSIEGVMDVINLTSGGLLVPPRDSKEIAKAVMKIIMNKKKFRIRRKDLLKYFGIERALEGYEKII